VEILVLNINIERPPNLFLKQKFENKFYFVQKGCPKLSSDQKMVAWALRVNLDKSPFGETRIEHWLQCSGGLSQEPGFN